MAIDSGKEPFSINSVLTKMKETKLRAVEFEPVSLKFQTPFCDAFTRKRDPETRRRGKIEFGDSLFTGFVFESPGGKDQGDHLSRFPDLLQSLPVESQVKAPRVSNQELNSIRCLV
jgi:hypothetical protein